MLSPSKRKALGADHPHVAMALHNLGMAACEAGNTEEAEGYYRRALGIQEKVLGVEHPHVAASLLGLGTFARKAEKPE